MNNNKKIRTHACLLGMTSVLHIASASGENNSQTTDVYFLDDAPVVLSATRLIQPLSEAPAAMTIIDKEMIQASGAKQIVELFRLVPGMQIGYKRGYLPSVTYHGMADEFSKGMQVLIDGQSVYLPSFGGVAWEELPILIEDIERIEVTRGPNAATYGPNSYMGVINIITTPAYQDHGIRANFRGGSREYRRGMLRYGGDWKDINFRISLAHDENDGFPGIEDDLRGETLTSRFDWQLTPQDSLMLNFGYKEGKSHSGSGALNDPIRPTKRHNIKQMLRWRHDFDSEQSLTMHLAHNQQRNSNRFSVLGNAIDNEIFSERIDFEMQHVLKPADDMRLVWGLGSRLDRMRMPYWNGDDDDKTNVLYRLFGNFEWRFLDNVTMNLGALVEKNSLADPDISPRLAINYLFSEGQTLRFSVARTTRMPTLSEKHLNVSIPVPSLIQVPAFSNRDLKPETAMNYEVGYHGQFLENKLVADMKFAYQKFDRLGTITHIHFNPFPVLEYGNGEKASSLNYELQLDYRPNSAMLFHFGYSWVNISSNAKSSLFEYKESAPNHTLNLLTSYKFLDGWQASIGYYYRSGMKYLRVNDDIGHFQRLDLVLQKSFNLSEKQKINFAFIHQNALGTNYDFSFENPVTDRTFLEVSYQFN